MKEKYDDVFIEGENCVIGGRKEKIAEKIGGKGCVLFAKDLKDVYRGVSSKGIKYIVLGLGKKMVDLNIFRKAKENKKVFFVSIKEFGGGELEKRIRNFREIMLFEKKTLVNVYLVNLCEKNKSLERRDFEYLMSFFGRKIRRKIE